MSRKKHSRANKIIRFGFMALIIVLVLSAAINYLSEMTYAFEINDNGYGVQISHEKVDGGDDQGKLFNISNMAPGEDYTEAITIKNVGPDSFQSSITAVNTSTQGNLLFDSLDFSIREESADGTLIFDGKLKDLENIMLCSLSNQNNRSYYMTLRLPAASGNEYQSKSAGFKFVITASADVPAE